MRLPRCNRVGLSLMMRMLTCCQITERLCSAALKVGVRLASAHSHASHMNLQDIVKLVVDEGDTTFRRKPKPSDVEPDTGFYDALFLSTDMNTKTNCSSGGWKLLYRGETEISSTIASLSEKLQLKVAPFLLSCCLFIVALKQLQGDPMPIHKPCVVGGYAVSLVFRLMPSQDCSWVACSLCGMCVLCLPYSAPFCNIHPCQCSSNQNLSA